MKTITSKRIPLAPRLCRTIELAAQFHAEEKTRWFPIDPIAIIKKRGWRLKTYTWMAASQGFTDPYEIKQVIRQDFDSEDAIVCASKKGQYLIAYNENMKTPSRINFTLMHEVGHIILGHLEDFPCGKMARAGLTDREYKVLEDEADCFARNVLTPAILAKQFKPTFPIDKCLSIFNISKAAWKTRLSFLSDDYERTTKGSIDLQRNMFWGFVTSKVCKHCGHRMMGLRKSSYCPFCGSQNLAWRNNTMKYKDVYQLNDTGRPDKCPRCENEDISEGEYCKICGAAIINRCTNHSDYYDYYDDCGRYADGKARFCIHCGGKTTYYINGFLQPWDGVKEAEDIDAAPIEVNDKELPF